VNFVDRQNLTSLRKSDSPVWHFGYSDFYSFRVKNGGKKNTKKSEDQGVEAWKRGSKTSRSQNKIDWSLKLKPQKSDIPVWNSGWSNFF
jgi:hypothetical protein